VTSQGHPYAIFRRALDNGNLASAMSSASDLDHVGLADALELCLLIRDRESKRLEQALLRWHARYCREVRGVGLGEAAAVLSLLSLLVGPSPGPAAQGLAELFGRRELVPAGEVLVRWANR